ncbi:MAG: methylenetetrahydrofolate reductase C-terminal domain-containing protein [Halobacteriota archaeon]|nr:methylenetetrahydrofolate reductase C-terminal domain-containing protein [Halobacteriota archaeon]
MIIVKQKPLDELLEIVAPYKNILVVGCDGCTQPPRSLKEAETLAKLIEMSGKVKSEEIKCRPTSLIKQCCNTSVANLRAQLEGVDAMLSIACGVGVQTLNELYPELQTFPAQDTVFIGSEETRDGDGYERCLACGDCLLDETGGICPITRCAKSLLNGPCGGCVEGKCEVEAKVGEDKTVKNDCAWYLIYHRLKDLDKLDLFSKYRPPRDNGNQHPQVIEMMTRY